jgi:hypothetical protein
MFDRLKKLVSGGDKFGEGQLLDGAYRPHRTEDVDRFTRLAVEAFPDFGGRIQCFGADWLGRQFALDQGKIVDGEPQVLMLEPGTGQALKIPVGYEEFHSRELVEQADAAVAYSFFRDWRAQGGELPAYDECVGYKVPLYLGGAEDTSNLELSDFEVYWSISGQLLAQVRGLPPGTKIHNISISE